MASHQAMQQSMALLPVGFENSSMPGGFGNFPPHFQTEMPAGPPGGYEPPHVVDGIPVEEAAHAFMPRHLAATGQQEPLSPTVTAAIENGGQFDPKLWRYPALPGETCHQNASNALQYEPGPSGAHHRVPTSVAPDSSIHYHDNYGNEQDHSWGMGLQHDNPDKLFDDQHTEKQEDIAPSNQDTNADEKDDDGDLLVESNQQQQMIS